MLSDDSAAMEMERKRAIACKRNRDEEEEKSALMVGNLGSTLRTV